MAKIVTVQQKRVQKVKMVQQKVAAEQVSDLKERVLQEVEGQKAHTFEAQFLAKKAALENSAGEMRTTRIVEGVTPPSRKRGGWSHDRMLTTALVAGVVVVIGLLLMGRQPAPTPMLALQEVRDAVLKGDVQALAKHVDFDRTAASVVAQYYDKPVLSMADVPADVKKLLPKDAQAASAMIKPGLAETLKQDALQVLGGDVMASEVNKGLFKRVWEGLSGGQPVQLLTVKRLVADDKVAEADILLQRGAEAAIVGEPAKLAVRMESVEGVWKVVALERVQDTIAALNTKPAEPAVQVAAKTAKPKIVPEPVPAKKVVEDTPKPADIAEAKKVKNPEWLTFKDVVPSAGPKKVAAKTPERMPRQVVALRGVQKTTVGQGASAGLLVTLRMTGELDGDVKGMAGKVEFRDSIGRALRSFDVTDTIGFAQGQQVEKTWKLPLNNKQRRDRQIARLPLEAMQVVFVPTRIDMADGRVLKAGI
ncbi:MAG: hypothetical protein WAX89_06195 [Alphaproteobacteria bacterium]